MIERWLQISCDGRGGNCGETAMATASDITLREFRVELGKAWRRVNGRDLCARCAAREAQR